ncbi:unnamed protein product [Urochloa humidicola]
MARAAARLLPLFLPWRRPNTVRTLAARAETLVLPGDERSPTPSRLPAHQTRPDYGGGGGGGASGTIAAIVTSLGGGPAAVGIVRLSGPDAVTVTRSRVPARQEGPGAGAVAAA